MATGTVSFNQRKAYGKKYSIDPAYALESERLANEYALAPQREARLEANRRFDVQSEMERTRLATEQDRYDKSQDQAAVSGLTNMGTSLIAADLMGNKGRGVKSLYSGAKSFFSPKAASTPEAAVSTPATEGVGSPAVTNPGAGAGAGGAITAYGVQSTPLSSTVTTQPVYTAGVGWEQVPVETMSSVDTGAGVATGMEAGASVSAGASTSLATVPVIGAIIAAALGVKSGMAKYAKGGSDEAGGLKGYVANTAQHPVGGVLTPGMSLVDTGVIGRDTLVGKIISAPSDLEEWVMSGGDTWLCTATKKHVGLKTDEEKAMRKLRRFARRNYRKWLNAYLVDGPDLIEAIQKAEKDVVAFYSALRGSLIVPVVDLVMAGKMDEAFELYKQITVDLCKKYAPQINTEVA